MTGKRDDIATGPFCRWSNLNTSASLTVAYVTATHQGLSGVYANTKPKVKTWKELPPIGEFPAVAHDFSQSDCQISIGLADDFSIDVTAFLSTAKQGTGIDPCESTVKAAGVVVDNLKKKAG